MYQDSKTAPTVAKINVTPIIDVALVLVIILLITAPMISVSDMEVDLPQAQTRSVEDEVRLSVTLGKSGALAVDDTYIVQDELIPTVAAKIAMAKSKNILVVVRVDASVPYDAIQEVIKDVKDAGAQRIAIATRQRGKS
jgi:biopolymer transport protein TolR